MIGVLYYIAAGFGSATLVVLTSVVPLPPQRSDRIRLSWMLSLLWLVAVVLGTGVIIQQTVAGVDEGLLPLVLFALGPGTVVAVVRIVLAVHAITRVRSRHS